MKLSRPAAAKIAAGIMVCAAALLYWNGRDSSKSISAPHMPDAVRSQLQDNASPETHAIDLASAADALAATTDAKRGQAILSNLKRALASASPDEASNIIHNFLESKRDSPTGSGFILRKDGALDQAPSLRTFLLDYWTEVDPQAAANYAEKVLSSKDSPDEWAVSLRAYARGSTNQQARHFLQQKFREMIGHEPWQKQPSAGFLEAFDVAVYTGGANLLPDIAKLFRQKENRAVAHASYLTIDRLVIREPAAVLEQLQSQPEWLEGREQTRANYFARANVQDDRQREILQRYLLDPRRSESELRAFSSSFPNANFMISHNLLTDVTTPTGDTLLRQDRASLTIVEQWLNDPQFEKVKPHLHEIHSRLQTFAGKN